MVMPMYKVYYIRIYGLQKFAPLGTHVFLKSPKNYNNKIVKCKVNELIIYCILLNMK